MEFLRFGSSIPGSYWGCCAVDIIQNFKFDPDAKASIQIVDGDGGNPVTNDKGFMFAGPTYRDIFWQRLRYGTFGVRDMPNHSFIAVLTDYQINNNPGKKWLAILKEAGFEFIRTVDNSVYTGPNVISKPGDDSKSSHPNHIFGLFRNIGKGAIKDPYTPPKAWTDLPKTVPELVVESFRWHEAGEMDRAGKEFNEEVQAAQLPLYENLPKDKFLSEAELEKDGVPVTYAGLRSKFPQQDKKYREQALKAEEKRTGKATPAPFTVPAADFEYDDEDEEF